MLTNKYFITAVVVLLVAAVSYNIWFFFLSEEERPTPVRVDRPAGPQSAGGDGDAGDGGGTAEGAEALAAALARERPALRSSSEMERLLADLAGAGAWGRDPLSVPAGPSRPTPPDDVTPAPSWVVTAIVRGDDRRSAVINGEVYREGERVDGGTVVRIGTREVVIRWRGRLVRVPLKPR